MRQFILAFSFFLPFFTPFLTGQNKSTAPASEIEMLSERIRLSYVDPVRCAQLLNFYGVSIGDPKSPIDPKKLPVVVVVFSRELARFSKS